MVEGYEKQKRRFEIMEIKSIAVVGPTASGKTRRAVDIARHFNTGIISADSRQVYRGMDIGTGKDVAEYGDVPAYLLDVAQAGEKYNLHRYLADFRSAYDSLIAEGKIPVICGGSGLYVESALSGIVLPQVDPNPKLRERLAGKSLEELTTLLKTYKTLHNITDVDCIPRAIRAIEIEEYYSKHPLEAAAANRNEASKIPALIIGIDIPREERRRRISERLEARVCEGMLDEVKGLLNSGIPAENLIYYGLEYKFLTLHLTGKLSYGQMLHDLEIAIHQFAKRQMTWFRGMERRGFKINWLPYDMPAEEFVSRVEELYKTDTASS